MFKVDQRDFGTHHATHFRRKTAGCIDHVFGNDVALVSDHLPLAVVVLFDGSDPGKPLDGCPRIPGQLRHRHHHHSRIDMTVIGRADDHPCVVKIHEGLQFFCFCLTDKMKLAANIFCPAFEIAKPLFLKFAVTNAQAAGLMEGRCLAGLFRQNFVIQADSVVVDFGNRHVADKITA